MATTFSGTAKLSIAGSLTNSDVDLQSNSSSLNYAQSYTYSNGTSTNQANMLWSDTRSLDASASESIDLAGTLTNVFGATVTFTKLKGIIIVAASGNTNNVLVGGAASNQFINWVANSSDIITVRPGYTFALVGADATGYAVTADTGDILKIANSSDTTSVTYDIILIGCV